MGNENSGWRGPDGGGTHVGNGQVAVKTTVGVVVYDKPGNQQGSVVNVAEVMQHVKENAKR